MKRVFRNYEKFIYDGFFKFSANIQESGLFMDAMLNVLNSAPKVVKKRKPKPENAKKTADPSSPSTTTTTTIPSLSPTHHLAIKTELPSPPRSPLHSPSTLDLDSLAAPLPPLSNADEPMSSAEPPAGASDYVPLSSAAENVVVTIADNVAVPDPEPIVNVEPIVEKPPQLKVRPKLYTQ